VKIAILGPGGVGGLLAVALHRAGTPVVVVAQEATCKQIEADGIRLSSVRFRELTARLDVTSRLQEEVDALVIATKAIGLDSALRRIECEPRLILPLLNGIDHLELLRRRFRPKTVVAGTIRVESDRPRPGVVVHTSPFLRVDIAATPHLQRRCEQLAAALRDADVPAQVLDSEPQVLWDKLVRLNALACTTSAYDMPIGPIRDTPELRADLLSAIAEGCAVAQAEGANIDPSQPLAELTAAHATLRSSMQRDIAAGRTPELDAIAGAVLRAGARHEIACPTIERLAGTIAARAGVPAPAVVA
jgi:2-dehydropantoate 2-reductase